MLFQLLTKNKEFDDAPNGVYYGYQVPENTLMPKGKIHELKYLIEIPIPYVDRQGKRLNSRQRTHWRREVEALLTECFGGFTPGKAPALNRVRTAKGQWLTLSEKGQVVLRSACSDRNEFLRHRDGLVGLVVKMGEDLNQADVFILAYASDSLLIEVKKKVRSSGTKEN